MEIAIKDTADKPIEVPASNVGEDDLMDGTNDDAAEDDSQGADEDRSHATTTPDDDEEEEEEIKSVALPIEESASPISTPAPAVEPKKKKRGKPQIPPSARKGRAPAVKGLCIPFRTVKKVSTARMISISLLYLLYLYQHFLFMLLFRQ